MSANVRLTERQETAAGLIARGAKTDETVALETGVNPRTVRRWRGIEAFRARVQTLQGEIEAQVVSEGIALRTKRVAALNDRWERMQRVIDERAESPEFASVPGGSTGLMVHTYKMIGSGFTAQAVDEYGVDTALLRELRAHEEQAAKEVGQWTEKQDVTSGGKPLDLASMILAARKGDNEDQA